MECMQRRSVSAGRSWQRAHSGGRRGATARRAAVTAAAATPAITADKVEDKWIARNVVPLASALPASGLDELRGSCLSALHTLRMPSTRNESFRFTDLSLLLKSELAAPAAEAPLPAALRTPVSLGSEDLHTALRAVVVDGRLRPELSYLQHLPEGVYVGGAAGAPPGTLDHLGSLSGARGGPFAVLNGAMASDVLLVVVPAGEVLRLPLHVLYVSTAAGDGDVPARPRAAAAPRLLVVAGADAQVQVVEEFVGSEVGGGGFTCAVSELVLGEDASVRHEYAQREAGAAVHAKVTLVQQAQGSSYTLVEACTGAALSRHDVSVAQTGSDTLTTLRHFILAGSGQLHDLHTKLELDHPRGEARQLHKCIVSHATGRGVFDGNVKVNRLAQKTDAGQLSRNLLLVPRATVNVKPNLQIVADDVKCTHGCAISDLSADELFYFRARGVSQEAARQALVYSFGAEVVQGLRCEALQARVQGDVVATLKQVEALAATSATA